MLAPKDIRRDMVTMIAKSNGYHIGPNLSVIEILYTLYFRVLRLNAQDDAERDRFVLSKGHCAASAYTVMAARGLLDPAALASYNTNGSAYPPIADRHSAAGFELSSGSIGRGISVGIGKALIAKREGRPFRTFVLIGDGECQEGSIWESVMLAPALGLDNLTVIVDANRLQAASRINEIMDMSNLRSRFEAFGWEGHDVDGHDIDALEKVLQAAQSGPKMVMAHTVKGKGVSMMEDQVGWHYRTLTFKELVAAMRELR